MARGKRTGRSAGRKRRCNGKRPYQHHDEANKAIDAMGRTRGIYTPDWAAYRCDTCGNYHIGHRPGLGRQRGI